MIRRAVFLIVVCLPLVSCQSDIFLKASGDLSPTVAQLLNEDLAELKRSFSVDTVYLQVSKGEENLYQSGFSFSQDNVRDLENFYFDIASLTKPIAGVPAAIELSGPSIRETVYPAAFLNHTSGFRDTDNLLPEVDTLFREKDDSVFQTNDLSNSVCYRYSNRNYIYLSWKATESGIRAEHFRDYFPTLTSGINWRPDIRQKVVVPAGRGEDGKLLEGHPFDPIAHYQLKNTDSLPLHSGLFATGPDVTELMSRLVIGENLSYKQQIWRDLLFKKIDVYPDCQTGRDRIVSRGGLYCAVRPPFAPDGSRAGRYFFITGYTGCFLWVDTKEEIVLLILSNASLTEGYSTIEKFYEEVVDTILAGRKELTI